MSKSGNLTVNNLIDPRNKVRSVTENIAIESGGFLVAEGVSIAAGLGTVAIADKIIPKPLLDYGSQILGKVVAEPLLDTYDSLAAKFCKLEECKHDKDESRAVRGQKLGRGMIVFGTAYLVGLGTKLITRRAWNDHHGFKENHPAKLPKGTPFGRKIEHVARFDYMSPHEKMIFLADEGVHYGALYLMNNQLAPCTDHLIRGTTSFIHKTTGFDEKKSHEIASVVWIWDAANILGAAAGIAAIAGAHAKGWPKGWAEKILANKPRPGDISHVEKVVEKAASAVASHLL